LRKNNSEVQTVQLIQQTIPASPNAKMYFTMFSAHLNRRYLLCGCAVNKVATN
jgi:hypothetical protein